MLIAIIIIAIYYFKASPNTIYNDHDNTANYSLTVSPSVSIDQVFDQWTMGTGPYAVKDEDGLIYYTRDNKLMVRDLAGLEHERYAPEGEEGMIIVGMTDELIVYIFDNFDMQINTCADMWSADNDYYGISKGIVGYSGPAHLDYNSNTELINEMKAGCAS
ncbi:MAG: hypothetical protein V1898_02920 [Patescibacteria group bacterium]